MSNSEPSNVQAPPPVDPEGPDPLAKLHKMSRTAGLGSTEYVAVNGAAVATLILGVLSATALILGSLLLFIPVVAVIVGIVAIRQVNASAGTQTGKGLAILGMIIAALSVAMVGGRSYLHARQVRAEQDQIVNLVRTFGENLAKGDYDAAWNQMAPKITGEVKKQDFIDFWTRFQANAGAVKEMKWNGYLDVQTETDTGAEVAHGVIITEYPQGSDRKNTTFRKTDTGWKIEDMGMNFTELANYARQPGAG
jgi:hypothetical protein